MQRLIFIALTLSMVLVACSSPPRTMPSSAPFGASLPDGSSPVASGSTRGGPSIGEALRQRSLARGGGPNEILVISGGGQNGAFGAGFLKGWKETGKRPVFDLVTGVSTGALSAPFAFLGTDADDAVIDELYLGLKSGDVYTERFLLAIPFSDSALEDSLLAGVVAKHVTDDVIRRVAKAWDEGRRLLVQTTCMDDGDVWIWDLTRIAKEMGVAGAPLFRQVMLASASVPIAFPPQFIEGWMHCDGSVRHDILLGDLLAQIAPSVIEDVRQPANVWVIVNSKLGVETSPTQDGLFSIGGRAVELGMDTSLQSSLFRSWVMSRFYGFKLGMVWIPDDVDTGANALAFNQKDMHQEFERGRAMAKNPDIWQSRPPLSPDVLRAVEMHDRSRTGGP